LKKAVISKKAEGRRQRAEGIRRHQALGTLARGRRE